MKYLLGIGLFCYIIILQAADFTQQDNSIVYKSSEDYDMTVENIKMAITEKGLSVSGSLHISDMLNRTAKDLNIDTQVFLQAESIEFCSAVWSHQMTQLNPLNLNVCPFTIAVFIKTSEPEQVYVAFRQPLLNNDENNTLGTAIGKALHQIVENSI